MSININVQPFSSLSVLIECDGVAVVHTMVVQLPLPQIIGPAPAPGPGLGPGLEP